MKKRLILAIFALVFALVGLFALNTESALAVSGGVQEGVNAAKGDDQPVNLFGNAGIFNTIVNVLLFIIGAVAVIMIVIGGLRYVLSGGDSNQVQSAKNTILYAVVGVIVALLAYAIINFVVGTFTPGSSNSTTTSGASYR